MKSDVLADSISDAAALPGGRYGVIIAVVAAVAALGVDARAYQPNGLARDVRRYPAPGILADAGGHKLHLRVMGAEHPGPTVILETGSGSFSSAWGWVQPEVAKFARVVSYDRAGLGWSEPGPQPRDAHQIARELHTALHNAGIEGPYILVGHSYGGHIIRVFTGMYSDEVAGLVFVDSSVPEHVDTMPVPVMSTVLAGVRNLAYFGVLRALLLANLMVGEMPLESKAEIRALTATERHWEATRAEIRALPAAAEQVRAAGSFGDLPLVVLSALGSKQEQWEGWQQSLVGLSARGERRIASAGHNALAVTESGGAEVAATIRDVIQMVEPAAEP